jgi:hypothetical protein
MRSLSRVIDDSFEFRSICSPILPQPESSVGDELPVIVRHEHAKLEKAERA